MGISVFDLFRFNVVFKLWQIPDRISFFFCYSHIYSKCGWMGMTTRISPSRDHHCDRIKLNARILEPHLYESIANKWSFALFHTDRHTHTHRIMIVIRLVISYTDFNTHPVFACISIISFVLQRIFALRWVLSSLTVSSHWCTNYFISCYICIAKCICSIPYITLSRQYHDNVYFASL